MFMEIVDLMQMALARVEESRVEVVTLEPAEVSSEVAGGLAQMVSELVHNAVSFSGPHERARVTGLFEPDGYLISISDSGPGITEDRIAELNRLLEDPGAKLRESEPTLGLFLVAGLAARHDISVRLVPGVPGTTARLVIPLALVEKTTEQGLGSGVFPLAQDDDGVAEALQPLRRHSQVGSRASSTGMLEGLMEELRDIAPGSDPGQGGGASGISQSEHDATETFLAKIFGPLIGKPPARAVPSPVNGNGRGEGIPEAPTPPARGEQPPEKDSGSARTTLRVRVPGQNFAGSEDEPSTVAAEWAIDIRAALTDYDEGRRAAAEVDEPNSLEDDT
jgi:anti-sigma regulatory factor (Ser/Thr protein kinase)